jgi:spermidine/putrescine transport system permease protein/putrescine transport system permease protein
VSKACSTVGSIACAACLVAAIPAWLTLVAGLAHGRLIPASLVAAVITTSVAIIAIRALPAGRLLMGYSMIIYALLYLPIIVVVVYAFSGSQSFGAWDGFSTKWFGAALNDPIITASVERSVRVALGAATISAVLGTTAALATARARLVIRLPFDTAVFLTLVVPELVAAISLLLFFVRLHVTLGTTTIMLGHAVFGTSVTMLIVRARFAGMGNELERVSADLGAGPVATFRQVTLPRLAPAIIAAGALVFTLSFDDVLISLFTSGAGNETWPLVILSSVRFGLRPSINATVVMMLAITLVVIAVTALALRVLLRRTGTLSKPPAGAIDSTLG